MLRIQQTLPQRYADASPDDLNDAVASARERLGTNLMILGHHYQRDDVIRWADERGDSYRLSVLASKSTAETIVFCGVHFMAEAADILTAPHQKVFLPDLNAGCSMADMASTDQVEDAWDELASVTDTSRVVPVTYMNSSAALKAFVARRGGAVCTSTNARQVLEWALSRGDKILFFPDQHLGRNTALSMGYTHDDMRVWNPRLDLGGLTASSVEAATMLLWKGHCSIHQRFQPEHVHAFREAHPTGIVIAHPECSHEVCAEADEVGSTDHIIRSVASAEPGAVVGVATEIHLVNRLAAEHPDRTVVSLDPIVCPCSTMNRIDLPHLAWLLDRLAAGKEPNRITVDPDTADGARLALQRMIDVT